MSAVHRVCTFARAACAQHRMHSSRLVRLTTIRSPTVPSPAVGSIRGSQGQPKRPACCFCYSQLLGCCRWAKVHGAGERRHTGAGPADRIGEARMLEMRAACASRHRCWISMGHCLADRGGQHGGFAGEDQGRRVKLQSVPPFSPRSQSPSGASKPTEASLRQSGSLP